VTGTSHANIKDSHIGRVVIHRVSGKASDDDADDANLDEQPDYSDGQIAIRAASALYTVETHINLVNRVTRMSIGRVKRLASVAALHDFEWLADRQANEIHFLVSGVVWYS
jgi:hypothetical protein